MDYDTGFRHKQYKGEKKPATQHEVDKTDWEDGIPGLIRLGFVVSWLTTLALFFFPWENARFGVYASQALIIFASFYIFFTRFDRLNIAQIVQLVLAGALASGVATSLGVVLLGPLPVLTMGGLLILAAFVNYLVAGSSEREKPTFSR